MLPLKSVLKDFTNDNEYGKIYFLLESCKGLETLFTMFNNNLLPHSNENNNNINFMLTLSYLRRTWLTITLYISLSKYERFVSIQRVNELLLYTKADNWNIKI